MANETVEKFHHGDGGEFYVEKRWDMQPNVEFATALRNGGLVNGLLGSEARHVARIDKRLLDKWISEAGLKPHDTEAIRDMVDKKLMNGEFSKLRVWEGTY